MGIDEVRALGATVEPTPEQSQFVRAFWMATPPASRELSPGNKAFLAKDLNGKAILGLFDRGQVCAVFQTTDWIERIVEEVGRGKIGKLGQAL